MDWVWNQGSAMRNACELVTIRLGVGWFTVSRSGDHDVMVGAYSISRAMIDGAVFPFRCLDQEDLDSAATAEVIKPDRNCGEE